MDNRSFQSGAAAAAPTAPASPSVGYPTDGNPATGTPATLPGDYWFHQVGEELRNVIAGAGLTPSAADLTQLSSAIALIAKNAAVSVAGLFKNLKIDAIGINNYNCVITADAVMLKNAAGLYVLVESVSKTINANGSVGAPLSIMSARAASTWYYRWLWYNQANGLTATLDVSSSAPTPPTGYSAGDYKALLPGACKTDASGSTYLLQISTKGRRSQFVVLSGSNTASMVQIASGIAGNITTPTWVAVTVGGLGSSASIPATAISAMLHAISTTSNSDVMVAPNNQFGAFNSATNPPPLVVVTATSTASSVANINMMLESSSVYWASTAAGGALYVSGWED